MVQNQEQKDSTQSGEHPAGEYQFIKENIKKKKPGRRKRFLWWLKVAGGAILFGVLAALVMALVYPRLSEALGTEETMVIRQDTADTDMSESEESSETSEITSTGMTEAPGTDSAVSETEQMVSDVSETANQETEAADLKSEDAAGDQPEEEKLMEVLSSARSSLVTVIGVTSTLDWFQETYEKEGNLSGLLVMQNKKYVYILTEYRVLQDVDRIRVTFCDGTSADAAFVKRDIRTGLAVIRVKLDSLSDSLRDHLELADFSGYRYEQGDTVYAMGSPMGYDDAVSGGMITAFNTIHVADNAYRIINTDISASEEGSGILVNAQGEIIGIMDQALTDPNDLHQVACIPLTELQTLVEDLCHKQDMAYVGIYGQNVTDSISANTDIPRGIWVEDVETDSPAMLAGIQNGDVITAVGDTEVHTLREFYDAISSAQESVPLKIHAMRKSVDGYTEIVFDVIVKEV